MSDIEKEAKKLLDRLNPEQREAAMHINGPLLVAAVAGAGKTATIIARIIYLISKGVDPSRILAVTFSRKGADEMNERLKREIGESGARVGTFHSLALQIVLAEVEGYDEWTIDDRNRYKYAIKDAIGWKELDWKKADITFLENYISWCKTNLVRPWDERAASIAKEWAGKNPGPHAIPNLMVAAYERAEELRRERRLLTFDDMLFEAVELLRDNEDIRSRWAAKWDFVIQDEAQDQNEGQLLMGELLAKDHRNYMLVGDPAQCHPPGTEILTDRGLIPIEHLKDGDTVKSWSRKSQKMIGGRRIKVGTRHYSGSIYTMNVSDRSVDMTDNHKVLCRWTNRDDPYTSVVYLMQRNDLGFRIGCCTLFTKSGFQLDHRMKREGADRMWVLGVYPTWADAMTQRDIKSIQYGIPTASFLAYDKAIFDIEDIFDRARRCLSWHGKSIDLPFLPYPATEGDDDRQRRRTYFPVYACNIIPSIMSVPMPDGRNSWAPIDSVTSREYKGDVYSLDVEKDHSYSANGIVVLNCIYTWRGAKPEKLLSFEERWGAKVIKAGRNYRCGQVIIDTANKVLAAMDPTQRLPMDMICEKGTEGELKVFEYSDTDEEGERIAEQISMLIEDGVEPRNISVLYRTNAQSRGIEEALISSRIPYRIIGGTNFYERKEVRDLLAYLRLAEGRGDMDDVRRCINSPFRFLGKAFVGHVQDAFEPGKTTVTEAVRQACHANRVNYRQRQSAEEWADLIDRMAARIEAAKDDEASSATRDLGKPSKILEDISRITKYTQWLIRDEGQETSENNRVSNIRELIRAAGRFSTAKELLDYIDRTISESKRRRKGKEPNKVTLTSLHRCVHPDTLVETDRGLIPISEAGDSGMIGTAVGAKEYINHVSFDDRDLLTIRTKNGYEITVTTDHGMMVWDGTEYVRREASQLQEGDFLRLRLGNPMEPSTDATLPEPPSADVRAKVYGLPSHVDEDLAEFLGLMVADGTVYRGGFRLKKRHKDVVDRFEELTRRIFGCEVKRTEEPSVYAAEVNSTFLSAWLLSIGGLGPKAKAVPGCILRSGSGHQAAFLRGLFEDGTVNVRGDKIDHVAIHTSVAKIAKTVQTMLLRQGIVSTRFEATPGQWRVAIYGSHAHTFRDKIGFVASFKNERLDLDVGADTRNLIPVDPEWVRESIERSEANLYDRQNAIARGTISREVAARWGLTEALAWHHDRIVSITHSTGPAMCVEVPGHGRFLQNGFDGCNSKGMEWQAVFLAGANQGVIPHARSEDIEEERRLFYVGVTRAKDLLTISCVRTMAIGSRVKAVPPSIFLDEAELSPQNLPPEDSGVDEDHT